jgi:hypothetical protein
LIKSACKPFTIGYDASKSALIASKKVEEAYKVQYIELSSAAVASDKPSKDFVFAAGQVSNATPLTISKPYDVTQYYTSAQSLKGYKRMLPLDLIALWVASYNS